MRIKQEKLRKKGIKSVLQSMNSKAKKGESAMRRYLRNIGKPKENATPTPETLTRKLEVTPTQTQAVKPTQTLVVKLIRTLAVTPARNLTLTLTLVRAKLATSTLDMTQLAVISLLTRE